MGLRSRASRYGQVVAGGLRSGGSLHEHQAERESYGQHIASEYKNTKPKITFSSVFRSGEV